MSRPIELHLEGPITIKVKVQPPRYEGTKKPASNSCLRRLSLLFSSLHVDCLTKWVKQFRLGIAINKCFAVPEASKQ